MRAALVGCSRRPQSRQARGPQWVPPIYHCTYADTEALDLLESAKDEVFVSPAVGIIWANVRGRGVRITSEVAARMGSTRCLEQMADLYPKLRARACGCRRVATTAFPTTRSGACP